MLLLWDSEEVEVLEELCGAYTLSVRCLLKKQEIECCITGVYGPNAARERKYFLRELWIVGGDFNIIRHASEKTRSAKTIKQSENLTSAWKSAPCWRLLLWVPGSLGLTIRRIW